MITWLRAAMSCSSEHLRAAYLFGSVLDPKRKPRDVDVVLVTVDRAGRPGWLNIRRWRDHLAQEFEDRFHIPLSAMVVTPSEWAEIESVVIGQRESLF